MDTTQALKLELIEWLANVKDQSLIQDLAKWKEDNERINVAQYNKDLDEADAEIDRGDFLTQAKVEERSKSW